MNKTFKDAYDLAFVEDDPAGAVEVCRQVLQTEPDHHDARMLIGCLLSDSADPQQRAQGRQHFIIALERWTPPTDRQGLWYEENPYYQLALWERKNGSTQTAAVIFAVDYVLHRTESSREQLDELVEDGLSGAGKQRITETLDAIMSSATKHICVDA